MKNRGFSSARALSKAAGLGHSYVSLVLAGKRGTHGIEWESAKAIAAVAQVDINWLMTGKGSPELNKVLTDAVLDRIEREHPQGLTVARIIEILAQGDITLSESSFNKYVKIDLLPRGVHTQGGPEGSQPLYPPSVIRKIIHIRSMMVGDYTIEQIQNHLFEPDGGPKYSSLLPATAQARARHVAAQTRDPDLSGWTEAEESVRAANPDMPGWVFEAARRLGGALRADRATPKLVTDLAVVAAEHTSEEAHEEFDRIDSLKVQLREREAETGQIGDLLAAIENASARLESGDGETRKVAAEELKALARRSRLMRQG